MDEQEFEKFIEKAVLEFESPLIGYARTFLIDLERSRDVVQDTFIRLCKQDIDKVSGKLKPWLFTVCRNRCLDVIRKDKRVEPLLDEKLGRQHSTEDLPDEACTKEERFEQILAVLDQLPANQKEVVLMKFHQGLSYKEIHKITGLKEGNIGFLIHAGLKKVRTMIANNGGQIDER